MMIIVSLVLLNEGMLQETKIITLPIYRLDYTTQNSESIIYIYVVHLLRKRTPPAQHQPTGLQCCSILTPNFPRYCLHWVMFATAKFHHRSLSKLRSKRIFATACRLQPHPLCRVRAEKFSADIRSTLKGLTLMQIGTCSHAQFLWYAACKTGINYS